VRATRGERPHPNPPPEYQERKPEARAARYSHSITPISLILLPGLDGTGLLFQPLLDVLPASIKPVVVRYPHENHLTYDELLPRVLESLPPNDEPFILLGESFSGPLAVMVAARHPPGLRGLILAATFVTGPWPIARPFIPIVARSPLFALFVPLKRLRSRLGGYATPQRRALMTELNATLRPRVVAARIRMVFHTDARQLLASCAAPVLYLRGTRDLTVPGWNLRTIKRICPAVTVESLSSSHMVLQGRPSESAAAIARFAATVS
jgi:pimeloyl-ACP methyl ester carboxylesterase